MLYGETELPPVGTYNVCGVICSHLRKSHYSSTRVIPVLAPIISIPRRCLMCFFALFFFVDILAV